MSRNSPVPERCRMLGKALAAAGVSAPVMVIDRDRLDANLDSLAGFFGSDIATRIVIKSLPVPALLKRALDRLGTKRVMTFSTAMLVHADTALGPLDHLFGKPVPTAAVSSLIQSGGAGRRLAETTAWLADTPLRLRELETLGRLQAITIRIALEIDTGFHRGGMPPGPALGEALKIVRDSTVLRYAGMVGYEPHIPGLPNAFAMRRRATDAHFKAFAQAQAMASDMLGRDIVRNAIRNSGGSKTLDLHRDDPQVNDVSVGSLLVKPTDFDGANKPAMEPAVFIATPVLKKMFPVAYPGFGNRRMAALLFDKGARTSFFIHGGHWLAEPVYPEGLRRSRIFGQSSNQEALVSNSVSGPDVGDYVFLRPHQSEAVMLQFGPVAVVSNGALVDWWETFPISA